MAKISMKWIRLLKVAAKKVTCSGGSGDLGPTQVRRVFHRYSVLRARVMLPLA